MAVKNERILGPVDGAFYYVESQKTPMNIGAVCIFDGILPFDELVKFVDSRIYRAPIYQQKIVQAPMSLGQPTWMFDPDFYVGNHIFRLRLESPGNEEQLRQLAGRLISSPLNRDKPLWEMHVIEGLSDNRTAILFKVHHCMVDGLAAVELLTLLFDLTPDIAELDPKPLYDVPPIPDTGKLIVDSIRRDIPQGFRILRKVGGELSYIGSLLADKEKRRKTFIGVANLLNDNLRPIRKLPINGRNSGRQNLAWTEFSLAEIRAIKSGRNASVNDVMLTILSTAIMYYLQELGTDFEGQNFLRVLVPVSMRMEDEKEVFGNRISVITVDIPFAVKNPLDRLDAVATYSKAMKDSSLSVGIDLVLTLPALLPSITQPLVWTTAPLAFSVIAHTWCTNVAGPQIPVYLLGKEMKHSYGYFPLNPSFGMACVIMSYNQRISMNLVADAGIIPDIRDIRKQLDRAFLELRSAAKVQPIEPIIIERTPKNAPEPVANTAFPISGLVIETAENGNGASSHVPEADRPFTPKRITLFSDGWAKSYMQVLNNSKAYHDASTGWTAGALAMVMKAAPANGFPRDVAVILDLHKGKCKDARALTVNEATSEANYVIEGNYGSWMKVLSGQGQPLGMIMRGQLRLKKGSLPGLLPYTKSAQELIKCAQKIDEFEPIK
ncbi:MAG: wax ester/triacylglycerol synthase family O-acyltransferase [Phototrophicales bacterium]|nr:wax ester/triacylglycerol synthase family O-acyltransferase [Phototrophicales bacterium]